MGIYIDDRYLTQHGFRCIIHTKYYISQRGNYAFRNTVIHIKGQIIRLFLYYYRSILRQQ